MDILGKDVTALQKMTAHSRTYARSRRSWTTWHQDMLRFDDAGCSQTTRTEEVIRVGSKEPDCSSKRMGFPCLPSPVEFCNPDPLLARRQCYNNSAVDNGGGVPDARRGDSLSIPSGHAYRLDLDRWGCGQLCRRRLVDSGLSVIVWLRRVGLERDKWWSNREIKRQNQRSKQPAGDELIPSSPTLWFNEKDRSSPSTPVQTTSTTNLAMKKTRPHNETDISSTEETRVALCVREWARAFLQ
ncbi:hypothetical protein HRR83_005822 [Exophiala dermatitidis]|uniref:Uncharacterized protein n=1 Tax=Exophiala dermatitidis TaxID=5970 RepID=A0AAN6EN66_EXODE|nr:hypothetical protein HRR73_007397 [Exophiala dermatitidis]KAJ4513379.1 hypothetical protein HRR74_006191 [Exophiala dermatitidis]KAJ4538070.1 hypothetical protein HRR77_007110 [Exophiala dermatitidis]KAJ4539802.1 hypothetical protein HRR76_003237 [Exophiala dermatitidis]KAJ4562361.1 hypothetical protein HRR79_006689 [Exophiala dermatitidis]